MKIAIHFKYNIVSYSLSSIIIVNTTRDETNNVCGIYTSIKNC